MLIPVVETVHWTIPWWDLFASRLFVIYCWMLFIGYRLGYEYFGWVARELVVSGDGVHIRLLWPSGTLCHHFFGLLRPIGQTRWLPDGLLCLIKCILIKTSGFALRSAVFGAPIQFWILWLFELFYVHLDILILILLSTWYGHEKGHP